MDKNRLGAGRYGVIGWIVLVVMAAIISWMFASAVLGLMDQWAIPF